MHCVYVVSAVEVVVDEDLPVTAQFVAAPLDKAKLIESAEPFR